MRTPSSTSISSGCGSSRRRVASVAAARPALSLVAALAASLTPLGCGPAGGGSDGGSVAPAFAPTFANINANVFQPSCAKFSACHASGAGPTVGGLDLATNPYLALLGDGGTGAPASDPAAGSTVLYHYDGMLLVKPGDPAHSLLYLKLTTDPQSCTLGTPQTECQYGAGMPSTGTALPPGDIESVREWIANGAKND